MRNLRKSLVLFLISWTMGALTFSLPAANAAPSSPTHSSEQKMKALQAQLKLTPQQLEEIKSIRAKFKSQIHEKKAKVCELREDLQKNLMSSTKGPAFQTEMEKKFELYRSAHNEVKFLRFKLALQIREILNSEQISKFNALQRDPGHPEGSMCKSVDND